MKKIDVKVNSLRLDSGERNASGKSFGSLKSGRFENELDEEFTVTEEQLDIETIGALLVSVLKFGGLMYYLAILCYHFSFGGSFSQGQTSFNYVVDFFFLSEYLWTLKKTLMPKLPSDDSNGSKSGERVIPVTKKSRFFWMLVGFELIAQILMVFPFEAFNSVGNRNTLRLLRIFRLIRVFYFMPYWRAVFHHLNELGFFVSSILQRTLFLSLVVAAVGHVAACTFYSLSLVQMKQGYKHTWISVDELAKVVETHVGGQKHFSVVMLKSIGERYLRALYWSVQTLDTVGFGDIVAHTPAETWYCIFFFFVSALLIYLTIAHLVMFAANLDSSRTENLIKISTFDKYASYRKLPKALSKKVRAFYAYQWQQFKGIDELQILSELPPNISQQVIQCLVRDVLIQVDAFKGLSKGILNSLSEFVDSYTYSPGDIIVMSDTVVVGLYVISNGEVEHLNIFGNVVEELRRPHCFGDRTLLTPADHRASPISDHTPYKSASEYRAKTFVEIFYIDGDVFKSICHPELLKLEESNTANRMHKALEGLAHSSPSSAPAGTISPIGMHSPGIMSGTKKDHLEEVRSTEDPANSEPTADRMSIFNHIKFRFGSVVMGLNKHKAHLRSWRDFFFPQSTFRMLWDFGIFLIVVFYVLSVPLLISGTLRQYYVKDNYPLIAVGYACDFVMLVDLVCRLTVFSFLKNGILFSSLTDIRKNFLEENNLALVSLAYFPLDLILALAVDHRCLPLLRLLKILHVTRLSYLMRNFEEVLIVFCDINLSFEMSRFLGLYFLLFLLCHWMGCIWQLTSDFACGVLHDETCWRQQDMHSSTLYVDYKSMSHTVSYFRSLYFASNVMSSIGFSDSLPTNSIEVAIMIFVIFFGVLLFNTLLGSIAALMSNFNRDKKEFDSKVSKIKALMTLKNIPTDLETRILRYHEYVWARYGGVKESEMLNSLPRALRAEVTKHVMGPLIRKISFFCRSSEVIQQLVIDLLRPRIFLDDDAIVLCGELGKEMFIIEKGTAIVTAVDKTVVYNTLSDGDYIGESSLLAVTRRTASAYAVGYVGTYYLTSDGFYNAFDKFPAEYSKILNFISITQKIKQQMNIKSDSHFNNQKQLSLRQLLNDHENSVSNLEMVEINNRDLTRRRGSDELLYKAAEIQSKYTLHPESVWKLRWDVMIFCTLLYYSIVIPLRIALRISPWIYFVDYLCDIINIADDYLYSSVFATVADGRLLTNVVAMRAHYLRSERFLIDLACAFPWDIIVLYTVTEHFTMANRLWVLGLLRLPKMVKLLLVQNYFLQVERLFMHFGVQRAWFRLVGLTGCVLFISHWVACIWFLFSLYVHPVDGCALAAMNGESLVGCKFTGTWVQQQIMTLKLPADGGGQWSRFLRAINWSLPNLTSESLGDLNGINAMESLFTFFTLFVGLSINGVIIGSVTSLVSNANEDASHMFTKIDMLRDFLTKRGVPHPIISNATSFLMQATSQEGGLLTLDQDKIFSKLPHTLLYAVNYHLKTLKFLRQCPFFDFCSDEVLRGISSKMKVRVYCKGDKIVNSGELGNEMFFLESGKVNVLSVDNKTVLSSLEDGAFFGETGLFFKTPRVASVVVSSSFCVCMILTKVDLNVELRSCDYNSDEVLKSFKELQNSNQNRNICVLENLKAAKNPDSKLHKMIIVDDEEAASGLKAKSLLQKIRIWLRPDGWPRIVWDCMGFLFLVYYCTSIPVYIAFFLPNTVGWYLSTFIWIDFLIDAYFVVDILCKYFLFSFKLDAVHNKLCSSADAIRQKYVTEGYFYYDVMGSIPFEFLVFIPGSHPLVLFMCRVSHLMRAPQLIKYAYLVESHVATLGYALSQSVSLLFKAGFAYILLTHWLACVYFAIHRYAERTSHLTYVIADGLATFDPVTGVHDICSKEVSFCYARSIYFVLGTLTSIGYGDISPYTNAEFMWQQVVAIMGAFIAATFVGFSEMYWNSVDDAGDCKIKNKLREVEYYAGLRKLDPELRDLMLAQYEHSWKQLKSVNGDSMHLFDQLSDACQMEIFLHLHSDIVAKVLILNDLPYQAKRRFAAALKPQIALRSSYVYRAGDIGLSFFFVSSGQVTVNLTTDTSMMDSFGLHALKLQLNKQTRQGVEYDEGTHFGECCLLSNAGIRNDSAQVTLDGEMYSMNKSDFWHACQYMPFAERRRFLLHLFGTVGIVRHVKVAASAVSFSTLSEDEGGDDTHHIKYLYSLAFGVVTELSKLIVEDNMKQDSSDDDDEEDDDDDDNDIDDDKDNGNDDGEGLSKHSTPEKEQKKTDNGEKSDDKGTTASPATAAKTNRTTVRHHNGRVTRVKRGTFRTERSSSKVGPAEYQSLEPKPTPIRTRLSTLFLGNRIRGSIRPLGLTTAAISRRDNIKIGKASVLQVKQLLHNKNLVNDLKIKTETHLLQEQRLLSKRRNLSMLSSFADNNVSSGLLVDNDSGKFKEASARLTHMIAARRLAGGLEMEKDDTVPAKFDVPLTIVEENEGDDDDDDVVPPRLGGGMGIKKSESGTEECSPFVDDRKEYRWREEQQSKRDAAADVREDVLMSLDEADDKLTVPVGMNRSQSGGYSVVPTSTAAAAAAFSPLVKREVFKVAKAGEKEEDKVHSFPTPLRMGLHQQESSTTK